MREAVITPRGKAATDRIDAARETLALPLFQDWETTDFDALVRLLAKLAEALDAPRGAVSGGKPGTER